MPFPPLGGYILESLNQWPGHISSILFLIGCNLRCPYCHAAPLLHGQASARYEDFWKELEENSWGINGIEVTGGEPTIHPSLPHLLREVHRRGFEAKLHTNGTNPDILAEILESGLLQCLAMDLKTPLRSGFEELYKEEEILQIRRSLEMVARSGLESEIHTTVCPKFIGKKELEEMCELVPPQSTWFLQRYEPSTALHRSRAGSSTFSPSELEDIAKDLSSSHEKVRVVGVQRQEVRRDS